jgi:hypothetical protein
MRRILNALLSDFRFYRAHVGGTWYHLAEHGHPAAEYWTKTPPAVRNTWSTIIAVERHNHKI